MGSYAVPFEVQHLAFGEALDVLHSTLKFGICPLLETVEDMLAELGDPDLCYGCVQVAGTNGKTSTSRYTAAMLASSGLKVALYTSPELVSYTERMEVGGSPVSEELFAHGIACAAEAGRRVNERRAAAGERPYDITEFDLLTVAALVVFAEQGVDVAVLEVGMGGRWDATSAAKSIRVVAVTGIGLDHMRILGDTLEAIAAEKAAVIKRGRSCVLGPGTFVSPEVAAVFEQRCANEDVAPVVVLPGDEDAARVVGCPCPQQVEAGTTTAEYRVGAQPTRLGEQLRVEVRTPCGVYRLHAPKPAYQAQNIACALALAEAYLGGPLDGEALVAAVAACPTPGRFDVVRATPVALVDACHNPQSVEAFLGAVAHIEPDPATRPTLLCAIFADKDVRSMVGLLAAAFPRVVVTQTRSPRAMPATELADMFRELGREPEGTYASVAEALGALADVPFVACGSITTAGEVTELLRGSGRS